MSFKNKMNSPLMIYIIILIFYIRFEHIILKQNQKKINREILTSSFDFLNENFLKVHERNKISK